MLNKDDLKKSITEILESSLKNSLETSWNTWFGVKSKKSQKKGEDFAKTVSQIVSENVGEGIAEAIDYYIKSGVLTANILLPPIPCTTPAGPGSTLPFVLTINSGNLNMGNPAAGVPGPNAIKIS